MRRRALLLLACAMPSWTQAGGERVYAQAERALARVEVTDEQGRLYGRGSGVFIAPDLVVTACHLLGEGHRIRVSRAEKSYDATLDVEDAERGLCRLRVQGLDPAEHARIAFAEARVGQEAYALGYPLDLGLSISEGLVSGMPVIQGERYVQVTAAVAEGSSGGGLFDAEGRLLGITLYRRSRGQNISFALPSAWIAELDARALRPRAVTRDWLNEGVDLENQERWSDLLELARAWIKAQPEVAGGYFVAGIAHARQGSDEAARAAFAEATTRDPGHISAWVALADACIRLGRGKDAIDAAQGAVGAAPNSGEATLALARAYQADGRDADALAAFEKASRVDPWSEAAWLVLARVRQNQGRQDEALNALRQAVRLNPGHVAPRMELAELLSTRGEGRALLEQARILRDLAPDDQRSHAYLSIAYRRLGHPEHAIASARKATTLAATDMTMAWYLYGRAYAEALRHEEAAAALREGLKHGAANAAYRILLGKSLLALNRVEEAVSILADARALEPEYPDAWLALGDAYYQQFDFAAALSAYQEALKLTPGHAKAWLAVARCQHLLDDRAAMREAYVRLKALDAPLAVRFYRDAMLPRGEAP